MPGKPQSYADPAYKKAVEDAQLMWVVYAVVDNVFRAELFKDPDAISNQLGLTTDRKTILKNFVKIPRMEERLKDIHQGLVCDSWPCPPYSS
ncbi:hypothetical protein L0244_21095 [bacterium]|nr:hypothetical protein [bacterium]